VLAKLKTKAQQEAALEPESVEHLTFYAREDFFCA